LLILESVRIVNLPASTLIPGARFYISHGNAFYMVI
jgi:hypothetical protein